MYSINDFSSTGIITRPGKCHRFKDLRCYGKGSAFECCWILGASHLLDLPNLVILDGSLGTYLFYFLIKALMSVALLKSSLVTLEAKPGQKPPPRPLC